MKRKIVYVISILLIVLCFAGCSLKQIDINLPTNNEEKNKWSENCLLTINGVESDYREAFLYLLAAKEEAQLLYGSDIWELVLNENKETYGSLRKKEILEEYIRLKLIVGHAGELNVMTYEEENMDIAEFTENFIKNVGRENLVKYGISETIVKTLYTNNILATKVYEAVTLGVDTNVTDAEARQFTYQYIFKSKFAVNSKGEKDPLDDKKIAELAEKMKILRETGMKKADFESYAKLNTDATSVKMTIGAGELDSSIEQIVLSLGKDEFSPVLETEEGFYIFKCILPFDEEATQAKKEEILSKRQKEAFEQTYKEWEKNATININTAKWESLVP